MDAEIFEEIYKKYFDMIYRIAFVYMKNEEDALDIVQDVFIKVWNGKVVVEEEKGLKAWFVVTTSNACKSKLKSWWIKKRSDYSNVDENKSYNNTILSNSNVLEKVMSLESKYRIPIYLYYYEGYTTIEIGKLLVISDSTIRNRLAKARKLLKISLTDEEVG